MEDRETITLDLTPREWAIVHQLAQQEGETIEEAIERLLKFRQRLREIGINSMADLRGT